MDKLEIKPFTDLQITRRGNLQALVSSFKSTLSKHGAIDTDRIAVEHMSHESGIPSQSIIAMLDGSLAIDDVAAAAIELCMFCSSGWLSEVAGAASASRLDAFMAMAKAKFLSAPVKKQQLLFDLVEAI